MPIASGPAESYSHQKPLRTTSEPRIVETYFASDRFFVWITIALNYATVERYWLDVVARENCYSRFGLTSENFWTGLYAEKLFVLVTKGAAREPTTAIPATRTV